MIIDNPYIVLKEKDIFRIRNCMIFDSYPLMIFVLGRYINNKPSRKNILREEDKKILECVNNIITIYRINFIYITPNIFAEFLNLIRNFYKDYYKKIKIEAIEDLKKLEEIYVEKDKIITHENFIEYGNDISLVLACESKLSSCEGLSIVSKDGRFLEKFYDNTKNVYCFNLSTLEYFY